MFGTNFAWPFSTFFSRVCFGTTISACTFFKFGHLRSGLCKWNSSKQCCTLRLFLNFFIILLWLYASLVPIIKRLLLILICTNTLMKQDLVIIFLILNVCISLLRLSSLLIFHIPRSILDEVWHMFKIIVFFLSRLSGLLRHFLNF